MKARKLVKRSLKALISYHTNVPVTDIKEFKDFSDLGIYSFQLEDLKSSIMEQMGIEVKKKELRACDDLFDMIGLILEKLGVDGDYEVSPGSGSRTSYGGPANDLTWRDWLRIGSAIVGVCGASPLSLLGLEVPADWD
jgi:acyl carrier protein